MSDHAIGNGSATGNGHTSAGSALTTTPFPASRKVYVQGSTARRAGADAGNQPDADQIDEWRCAHFANEPITIYDTSGPYTDPSVTDRRCALGLAPLRRNWILGTERCRTTPGCLLAVWPPARGRSQAGRTPLSTYSQAASRQTRHERHPDSTTPARASSRRKWSSSRSVKTNPAKWRANWPRGTGMAAASPNTPASPGARASRPSSRRNLSATKSRVAARSFRPTSTIRKASR